MTSWATSFWKLCTINLKKKERTHSYKESRIWWKTLAIQALITFDKGWDYMLQPKFLELVSINWAPSMFRKISYKCQGWKWWGVGVRRRLFRTGADGGTAALPLPAGICIIKTLPTFSLSFRSCGLWSIWFMVDGSLNRKYWANWLLMTFADSEHGHTAAHCISLQHQHCTGGHSGPLMLQFARTLAGCNVTCEKLQITSVHCRILLFLAIM